MSKKAELLVMSEATSKVRVANSRVLAGVALFAALTLILDEVVKVPAPYASFLTYEIWEIPIVVAFLLFGTKAGVGVLLINFVALQVMYPGALITGPVYNLSAVLLMLFGLRVATGVTKDKGTRITMATATGFGIVARTIGMAFLMNVLMPMPPPVGFAIPPSLLTGFLLLIVIFNATVSLYTIPTAYWLAETVKLKKVAQR